MFSLFRKCPGQRSRLCLRFGLIMLLVVAVGCNKPTTPPISGDYLFCFWNVENFFDNKINGWHNEPDKEFDRWFANEPAVFEQKVKNLTEVLAALNNGRGPDILALAEVETDSTAAEALRDSLNRAITLGTPPYRHIVMKNPHGGRNIATAILTRLPPHDLHVSRHRLSHSSCNGQQRKHSAFRKNRRRGKRSFLGRKSSAGERGREGHQGHPSVAVRVPESLDELTAHVVMFTPMVEKWFSKASSVQGRA